jgi:uncharacterized protein YjbI with pentapeptide repeats
VTYLRYSLEPFVSARPFVACAHRGQDTGTLCTGGRIDGFDYCWAHLEPDQLFRALQRLHPGADLLAVGTILNDELLAKILDAVQDDEGRPSFGNVSFGGSKFLELAMFRAAQFSGRAWFAGAEFGDDAVFAGAAFTGDAVFDQAQFRGEAWFNDAEFAGNVTFVGAQFFSTDLDTEAIEETEGLHIAADVTFEGARFEKAMSLGPLVAGTLCLDKAVFERAVVIQAAALKVSCRDVTWNGGADLRLRYADVDLERAKFNVFSLVTGSDQPFEVPAGPWSWSGTEPLNEQQIRDRIQHLGEVLGGVPRSVDQWIPSLTSLSGCDAANLSLTEVDLSRCRFAGTQLLDQLRLEGRCIFDRPPRGTPLRAGWWSSRQSIAEERIWRATTRKYAGWSKTQSTEPAAVGPDRLAGLYRQLRKAQEDAKNQPGAADFYYGEMEMRRNATTTPAGERVILWLYWLISGYGLRALRSLADLLVVGVVVTTALVGWGLAASAPPQHLTGSITSGTGRRARIDATLTPTVPQLPPAPQRWTGQRTQTALEVTIDSMVFRTTDQPLTAAGGWITDIARILGPVLLALALLAVRGRVKR